MIFVAPGAMPPDRAALAALARSALVAEAGDGEAILLHAAALLKPGAHFGRLLASGALESAALALLPGEAGYMLSRGANGCHVASVALASESTAEAASAALALVAALAGALAAALPPARRLH
ncbi:MAG: hypothetical protein KGK11_09485 [Sphingomonadales bacterium]|nr:hypothetical protein [Sphingomonadales bacterium]